MYSKERKIKNLKEKLNQAVCNETSQDIEEFLFPKFDMNVEHCNRLHGCIINKRTSSRRIVKDGHGKWREINIDGTDSIQEKYDIDNDSTIKDESLHKQISTTPGKTLVSNHILDEVKSVAKPQSSKSTRETDFINYKTLSTNTRANIFPGVGKYNWYSQSNNVYSETALKLGTQCGRDLQDEFYGITRDKLGAWHEASVHHERMKKAWDVHLKTLAKNEQVVRPKVEVKQNTKIKAELSNKAVKKSIKKQTEEENRHDTERKLQEHDEQIAPAFQQTVKRDDEFWDFFEQPFTQS